MQTYEYTSRNLVTECRTKIVIEINKIKVKVNRSKG